MFKNLFHFKHDWVILGYKRVKVLPNKFGKESVMVYLRYCRKCDKWQEYVKNWETEWWEDISKPIILGDK